MGINKVYLDTVGQNLRAHAGDHTGERNEGWQPAALATGRSVSCGDNHSELRGLLQTTCLHFSGSI